MLPSPAKRLTAFECSVARPGFDWVASKKPSLLHRVLLYFQQRDCSASEGFSSLDKYLFRLIMLTKKKKNSCEELYSVTFLSGPAAYKKQYHRNRVWDVQLNFCKKKKKNPQGHLAPLVDYRLSMWVCVCVETHRALGFQWGGGGGGGGGGKYSPPRCSAQCLRASPAGPALTGTAPTQSYKYTGPEEHTAGREEGETRKWEGRGERGDTGGTETLVEEGMTRCFFFCFFFKAKTASSPGYENSMPFSLKLLDCVHVRLPF